MKIKRVYGYSEKYGEIEVFLDESGTILGVVDSNDACWRVEYFNPIFIKLGILVESEEGLEGIEDKLEEYLGY